MNRLEKTNFVTELKQVASASDILIVTQQKGLTVSESTILRGKVREAGASLKVVKNSLARLALEGTQFSGAIEHLKGPSALSFAKDPVAAAKAIAGYAKENDKFVIVGAVFNQQVLTVNDVKKLASLPSLDELRAKILAVISAPAQKLATVISQPGAGLARVVGAYSRKS